MRTFLLTTDGGALVFGVAVTVIRTFSVEIAVIVVGTVVRTVDGAWVFVTVAVAVTVCAAGVLDPQAVSASPNQA